MQPPLIFDGSRAYNQRSNTSPTPPAFKLPPSYHKFSPISQDQGYHTMVGPHSSPEISPGASLDLSSLHLPCPKGVVRPRPPDVPPSIQLDHRAMTASYKSLSSHTSKQGMLDLLPDDLILGILKQLDSLSLVNCGQVCRRLYHLVWEPVLWTTVTLTGDTIDADLAVKSILSLLAKDSRKPSRCLSVTALHLSCCTRLSDAGLGVIARKCPALAYLDIRACKLVTNAGLAEVVARCSRLQHLDLTGCTLVSGLQPSCRSELRERLSKGLSLTHLDLTDCTRLDDQSLRVILQASCNIEYLYLRRCTNITDMGIKLVSAYCYVLRELSISDCGNIGDTSLLELARLGPKLRYLSAAKCYRVTDKGVGAIAKHCYKLRYLNVRGCESVSDSSIELLAKSCTRLRSLDIGKCDVTDAGLEVLSQNCPSLRKLSVRGCEMISDVGVQAVALHCRNLQQLNIQECQISVETYRTVRKFCKKCIIEHTNPGFH